MNLIKTIEKGLLGVIALLTIVATVQVKYEFTW